MKTFLALILMTLSTLASAEYCTSVLKDHYSRYEYQQFTRNSYSRDDACYLAMNDCQGELYEGQARGQYRTAFCDIVEDRPMPTPPNQSLICRTDLVDVFGNTIRQFTAPGRTAYEACGQSDQFCKMELARSGNYGLRCINRGLINQRNPYPRQPVIIEECRVSRLDPAGNFVEGYLGRAEGPRGTDVKGAACRDGIDQCQRELVGRQSCNIYR